MATLRDALRRAGGSVETWLARIADWLLNASRLVVSGQTHRLVEVEAYYHTEDHPDPFAHCDPVQLESGRWYFHKTRGTYRSGSFKGVDLTFGDGTAHGGFLFRGLETADGTLVDGPSLLVDHLLETCGKRDVASLDLAIGGRKVWDGDIPVQLTDNEEEQRPVFTSARVGLSLKKVPASNSNLSYLLRSYRFLTEPLRTAKGKIYLVLALHQQGKSVEEIQDLTGCPPATVRRYIEHFTEGKKETDLSAFGGVELGPKELCRLHGFGSR